MIKISGSRDNDVVGRKPVSVRVENRWPLKPLNRLFGAEDRLAKRMVLPEILCEDLVDQIIGVILVHLDFFHDDAALAANVGVIEYRVQDQIAEDIQSCGDVLVKNLDVEANTLLGGEGVHVAAN